MKLSLKISEHNAVVIREKWGVLAFTLFVDLSCIAMGLTFCILALRGAWKPDVFPMLFGGVFILLGLGHLLFAFPQQAKTILTQGGLQVLLANPDGLTLTLALGMKPHLYRWDDIAEIVLAKELKTIESDETTYMWNTVLVIFKPQSFADKNFFERAKLGISTSRNRITYIMSHYPSTQQDDLANALQRYQHGGFIIKCYGKAAFDLKNESTVRELP